MSRSLAGNKKTMKPTEKHPQIESFLTTVFGNDRRQSISNNVCVPPPIGCGGPANSFRNEKSQREFAISGLCQKCQDSIFGVD